MENSMQEWRWTTWGIPRVRRNTIPYGYSLVYFLSAISLALPWADWSTLTLPHLSLTHRHMSLFSLLWQSAWQGTLRKERFILTHRFREFRPSWQERQRRVHGDENRQVKSLYASRLKLRKLDCAFRGGYTFQGSAPRDLLPLPNSTS